jgi:TP901 family phage tail tape measure protein
MAQEQNYQVNYVINVEATQGTKQVMAFADSVSKLTQAKASLAPAVQNIRNMMADIDKVFRTKSGKKRDYSFRMNIDTRGTEEKLTRVKGMLTEIHALTKGINMVINAGQTLNSKQIKAQTKALVDRKALESQKTLAQNDAVTTARNISETQKTFTRAVGKINAALVSLERGRQVNIATDAARGRLQEILSLLGKIKTTAATPIPLKMNVSHVAAPGALRYAPYAAGAGQSPPLSKAAQKLQEKLYANRQLQQHRMNFKQQEATLRMQQQQSIAAARRMEREQNRLLKQQETMQRKALADEQRRQREAERQRQTNAMAAVRNIRRQAGMEESLYGGRRRAAINRLQYSRAPSLRTLPFAYMFNAWMMYGMVRKQVTEAVEYANIMETAHSILKVADSDLTTFETRFGQMARYVRQIGVETKFTAIEVAGAVKYLSMAGMGVGTILNSIRPITNLALIGDNDISTIADLATNIMAGYDVKSESMSSVADILASTVSRSNVNIVEMAESFKMAAGYMKLAGVDFTESAAAIGILGNMGIKGTMAGTSLRAMATRFAKPTRESRKTLGRLGVRFTEYRDVYGKQVEQLRPLPEIFADLERKGASMADMQAIFGKIGGNAAMMFIKNHDKLATLASQNKASQGISGELAKVKQDTTKGLWKQTTSMFAESFMQGYEVLEPQIRKVLRNFLSRFKTREFASGLAAIGRVLLDIFSTLGSIATWITKNFHWIEPLFFTQFVAVRIFKLAGAVTNLGIAFGFLGKQAAASSALQMLGGLAGVGGLRGMTYANKRSLVTAMRSAGIVGKGAMTQALAGMRAAGGGALLARGAAGGMFASQVSTGGGLIGAGASIAAIGTGAVAATAGIAALVAAMGWLAYRTWKVKEAKDAMQEEIALNRKYRYPSIDALYEALNNTYKKALDTKKAVDDLTEEKTVEEASGQKIGAFTGNWWAAVMSQMAAGQDYGMSQPLYTYQDARQDDTRAAILTIAKKDSQSRVNAAFAEFGKLKTAVEVGAFIQNIREKYGQADSTLDKSLWTVGKNGETVYKKGMGKLGESQAVKTPDYARYQNTVTVPEITRAAQIYQSAITGFTGAKEFMQKGGFDFTELENKGFFFSEKDGWIQKALKKNATEKERENQLSNYMYIHDRLVKFTAGMRSTLGGSAEAAENILKTAGFPSRLYSNEPDSNDPSPWSANPVTNGHLAADDGGAGGNYSGTGKLSSAAPKQVIVNITNLLSVEAIQLMATKEGNVPEIQDLKEQLAQALIDVVHDFDASWNGG